jgi:hypothetical protein
VLSTLELGEDRRHAQDWWRTHDGLMRDFMSGIGINADGGGSAQDHNSTAYDRIFEEQWYTSCRDPWDEAASDLTLVAAAAPASVPASARASAPASASTSASHGDGNSSSGSFGAVNTAQGMRMDSRDAALRREVAHAFELLNAMGTCSLPPRCLPDSHIPDRSDRLLILHVSTSLTASHRAVGALPFERVHL